MLTPLYRRCWCRQHRNTLDPSADDWRCRWIACFHFVSLHSSQWETKLTSGPQEFDKIGIVEKLLEHFSRDGFSEMVKRSEGSLGICEGNPEPWWRRCTPVDPSKEGLQGDSSRGCFEDGSKIQRKLKLSSWGYRSSLFQFLDWNFRTDSNCKNIYVQSEYSDESTLEKLILNGRFTRQIFLMPMDCLLLKKRVRLLIISEFLAGPVKLSWSPYTFFKMTKVPLK